MTTSLVFDQYTDRLRRKRRSPHSISAFASASTRLDAWLGARGLTAEIASYNDLEDYFDTLGDDLAPSSQGTHLRYIQAAYNYGVRRGTISQNPALEIEVPNSPDKEPIIISNECLRTIRDRIVYDRDWLFFHLLAYTGMRRAEIRGLHWDDGLDAKSVVKLEEQTIRVLGKGGKMRLIPIHPLLGEVLKDAEGEPGRFVIRSTGREGVAVQTMQEMTKRLSTTYTPHDYRRTVATSLARNEVPERIIDRIMGWAPSTVRGKFYINIATNELHRGILKLYADDPI